MAPTSTRPKQQSQSAASVPAGSRRVAQHMRGSTMPAYYRGRPAREWIALFRRTSPIEEHS
jgi:hypothetical protein